MLGYGASGAAPFHLHLLILGTPQKNYMGCPQTKAGRVGCDPLPMASPLPTPGCGPKTEDEHSHHTVAPRSCTTALGSYGGRRDAGIMQPVATAVTLLGGVSTTDLQPSTPCRARQQLTTLVVVLAGTQEMG